MVYVKGKYVISLLNSVDENKGFVLSESIYEVVSASQWRYKSTDFMCFHLQEERKEKGSVLQSLLLYKLGMMLSFAKVLIDDIVKKLICWRNSCVLT